MVQHGTDIRPQDRAAALARIPSGLFVLTLPDDACAAATGGRAPLLISFVQQVGFDPPRIVLALRKDRPAAAALGTQDGFVLNILGQEDRGLLKRFASAGSAAESCFDGLSIDRRSAGVVLRDAVAALECQVAGRFDGGDHWLILADVLAGERMSDRPPYVHVRREGLSY